MSTPNARLHNWAKQALTDMEGERNQMDHQGDADTDTKFEAVKGALEDLRDQTAEA